MSLGVLVARLGDFLGEQAAAETGPAPPVEAFADGLARIREEMNHHIIPLLLLARCDGQAASPERDAILAYCVKYLDGAAQMPTAGDQAALAAYLGAFQPTRLQLDWALRQLEEEPKERIAALIAAAQAVVDADRERHAREVRFLAELADELATL